MACELCSWECIQAFCNRSNRIVTDIALVNRHLSTLRATAFSRNQDPEPTCGAQDLERSIDVSLSAPLDGYELDCQRRRSHSICSCELFCSASVHTYAVTAPLRA